MDSAFMDKLESLRLCYGKPLAVSSAYRDATHPIEAKKAKPGSHSTGKAVDLLVSGADAYRVIEIALRLKFQGIGVNQKGPHGQRFIHLDTLDGGAYRPTIWSY